MEGRWAHYGNDGRVRVYENDWRLYCLFCMDGKDIAYVKIGISSLVYERMRALKTGLIFPMKLVLHEKIGNKQLAMHIEKRIHQALRHRKTRGEWFRFDLTSAFDKQEFHGVIKSIIATHTGHSVEWQKIHPDQLNAYCRMKEDQASERKSRKMGLQCA